MRPENDILIPNSHLSVAAEILGVPIMSAAPIISQGANNQVYQIETETCSFILKSYPETPGDRRDRFHAETSALNFMSTHHIVGVPKLIGSDESNRLAVMECISGEPIKVTTDKGIEAAINLVRTLYALRTKENALGLGHASEACPAPINVSEQIIERRRRLETAMVVHSDLRAYLEQKFDPAFALIKQRAHQLLAEFSIDLENPLTKYLQTLSPSDFGFHNALNNHGQIFFLDFEYFGWDDPVRLVSDFLFHPGHHLSEVHKEKFLNASVDVFSENNKNFLPRLEALYPLVGLRWCMILLNEFLPDRLARRRAAGTLGDTPTLLAGQLKKSADLLSTLHETKRVLPH
ncbi:aminoglycoside phosphotransferase family protein [Rhodospirillales bacterium]|nr:aminoglycoside phosphotransferase family protein [Rhodospirillales bacterium]